MKLYNKTFLVGVLALASLLLSVAQREAKAVGPSDSIQSYNMETTPEDREKAKQTPNHLFATMEDIATGDKLGSLDYDYTDMVNGSDLIKLKICLDGESCQYLVASGNKCLTSFAPYSINYTKNKTPIPLLQNLFSNVFDIVGSLEDPVSTKTGKSGRCIMEYLPLDGAPLIRARGADLPANVIKGSVFQIGPTDVMTDLYSRG